MLPFFFNTHKLGDNELTNLSTAARKKTWEKKKKKRKPAQRSSISFVPVRFIFPQHSACQTSGGSRGEGEEYIFPPLSPCSFCCFGLIVL